MKIMRRPYPNELFHARVKSVDTTEIQRQKEARRINSAYDAQRYYDRYRKKRVLSYEDALKSPEYDNILRRVATGDMTLDEGANAFASLTGTEPDDFTKRQLEMDLVVYRQNKNFSDASVVSGSGKRRRSR